MSRLFKNATLFYQDKFVNTDFMIDDKGILVIADLIDIDDFDEVIDCSGIHVFPGFVDPHVHLRQPGFEYKETIKTGTLAINYVDGNAIDTYALMPINEPDLSTEYSVYKKNFSVRSTGTLDQTLDIYMYITNNQFDDNILGYSLYDSVGNKLSKGDIPKNGRILLNSGIYLKSNEEKKFTVLIWLKENNKQQDYEMGKTFTGGFDITASQIKYK